MKHTRGRPIGGGVPPASTKPFRRGGRWMAGAVVLAICAAGCAKRYWTPTPEQRAAALEIAKLAALQRLSDQKDEPEIQALAYEPGRPTPLPTVFTIGDVSFTRYRNKMWGRAIEGRRCVIVVFADPGRVPDWETSEDTGGFPARFVVAVDVAAGRAIEPVPFDMSALQ